MEDEAPSISGQARRQLFESVSLVSFSVFAFEEEANGFLTGAADDWAFVQELVVCSGEEDPFHVRIGPPERRLRTVVHEDVFVGLQQEHWNRDSLPGSHEPPLRSDARLDPLRTDTATASEGHEAPDLFQLSQAIFLQIGRSARFSSSAGPCGTSTWPSNVLHRG
eukprot:scaffold7059_cov250-Pinguiococcus_pyrenoidosus.AAC.12